MNSQGFKFDTYRGEDNIPVVHVDTPESWDSEKGPKCRIYLNDECIYENPPYRSRKKDHEEPT